MSASNGDDDKEESDVEVFLSRGSFKPLVLPPPKPVSSAKRRWKLLKNVTRASRCRTSLTPKEESFLKAIDKPSKVKRSTSDPTTQQRQRLRASITNKNRVLTSAERAFLQSVVGNEDVSEDDLAHISQVLAKDPLYKQENVLPEKEPVERPKLPELDTSFRKETWTRYVSMKSLQSTRDVPEEKEEEEKIQKKTTKTSFIDKIFGRRNEDEKKEQIKDVQEEEEEEEPLPLTILATSANDEACHPHVLSPPMMDALRPHMPFAVQEDNFWLKYSMMRDGASLRALLQPVRSSARTIIAIETMDGDVFGSFTSSPWRPQGRQYYGSGEAFLWRLRKSRFTPCATVEEQIELESDIEVFQWTGQNRNVQSLVNPDSHLVLGGGGPDDDPFEKRSDVGSALMIESTLTRGTSDKCLTFDNPPLPTTTREEMFEIANIEVWTLTPVEQLEQAEKLELGRQFVFDHGNFIET